MHGDEVIVKPEDAYQHLQRWGYPQTVHAKIIQRAENIPSDQLDAVRKSRLITFLMMTKHEASLDEINAALVIRFLFKTF